MTMHLIVCPHCGKQMKTKVLVKGTIRCPGCQVRFRAPEPHQGVAVVRQDEAKHDTGQIIMFTLFGMLFVYSFFATGGVWFIREGFEDDWWVILGPFYLALMFLGLFFFMPLISLLFGKEPNSRGKQVVTSNSTHFTGLSRPPLPQETNPRRAIMGITLAIGLVFAIISLLIFAVIVLLFGSITVRVLGWTWP